MSDTRTKVELLLNTSHTLLDYYEREDSVIWCLTDDGEEYIILRIEDEKADIWERFYFEYEAQAKFNDIVEEFS